jgi:FMN phosphatase YigB (HAD superfamily)
MKLIDTNTLTEVVLESGREYVFFDVFDTIVHRKIHPEDIKKVACDRLASHFRSCHLQAESVYEMRAGIERELCFRNRDNGLDLEFRFEEMAASLYKMLKHKAGIETGEQDFIALCRQFELTAELTNQFADESIIKCIKELHEQGRKVYCCSDIYLDADFVRMLLAHHGLTKEIKGIFVSSAYCITKRTGKLYDIIIREFHPDTCMMIGDNYESDSVRAGERGIPSVHLDRTWVHSMYAEYQQRFTRDSFAKRLEQLFRTYGHVHFREFSLTSFYFIQQLHEELTKKGYKEVYFLAREGLLLKEMFDLYQELCAPGAEAAIKSHYLKVSRRSTFLPSLKKLEKEVFFNLFRQYRSISAENFLCSLGFSDEEINRLVTTLNIDKTRRESDFPTSEAFIRLLISDDFYNIYERKRTEQKDAFKKYFNSFSNLDKSRAALVDVGWKGTIQDNIYHILDEKTAVEGFYIGLVVKPDNSNTRNTKTGLLFSMEKRDSYYDVFDENRSFFEVFFAADHGSAVSYNIDAEGRPYATTEDFTNEEGFYKGKVYPLIQDILPLFKDICCEFNSHCTSGRQLYDFVAKKHARMFLFPSREEIGWYMDLYHVENFGIFEKSVFGRKGKNVSVINRLQNYYMYKKYPEKFVTNVIWPAAEFSKHGLGVSFRKYSQHKYSSIFK